MTGRIVATAAALLLASASPVEPSRKSSPRLELTSLSGAVHFLRAGAVQAYSRGSPLPVEVPLGTEVTVRGAKAEFRGMGILVRAAARDTFTYDLVNGVNDSLAIHIAAMGEDTAMEVVIGDSSALLEEGDAIAVSEPAAGSLEVRVLAGAPVFLSAVRNVALGPGQVWAWPLVSGAAVAVASGEELRSAVGPKPALSRTGPVVRPVSRTGLFDLGALTPLAPDPYWRPGMGGDACRVGVRHKLVELFVEGCFLE